LREHDWLIEHSGGLRGTRDLGILESALEHVQNDVYYPEFHDKLTHLVFAINKFHAFNDGNKRSSIVLGAFFLELNGYDYCVKKFIHEMENIAVWLAEGKINKDLLHEIIISIVMDDDYPEGLKLKIVHAVGD
jgi:death-on-curing protein